MAANDLLAEYQALQKALDDARAGLARAEEREKMAREQAESAAAAVRAAGFSSLAELQDRRVMLEKEIESVLARLKEAVG